MCKTEKKKNKHNQIESTLAGNEKFIQLQKSLRAQTEDRKDEKQKQKKH